MGIASKLSLVPLLSDSGAPLSAWLERKREDVWACGLSGVVPVSFFGGGEVVSLWANHPFVNCEWPACQREPVRFCPPDASLGRIWLSELGVQADLVCWPRSQLCSKIRSPEVVPVLLWKYCSMCGLAFWDVPSGLPMPLGVVLTQENANFYCEFFSIVHVLKCYFFFYREIKHFHSQ